MKWSLQITYRNVEAAAALEEWICEEAEKLDTFYDRIMGCDVAVEVPHRHHRRGDLYHVRIQVKVPGGEIVVNREPSRASEVRQLGEVDLRKHQELEASHKYLRPALKAAFRVATRRLQDYARCRRGAIKIHAQPATAYVSKIDLDDGYGFLVTDEGREIYFHENSVLREAFQRLKVGTKVSFVEERGEKGPQASTVRIVGHQGMPRGEEQGKALVH
jgi:cold shock CspA family protein